MSDIRQRVTRAYYYSFDYTGIDELDDLIEALHIAGKLDHNTSEWQTSKPSEFYLGLDEFEGLSSVDLIQKSISKLKEKIKQLMESEK